MTTALYLHKLLLCIFLIFLNVQCSEMFRNVQKVQSVRCFFSYLYNNVWIYLATLLTQVHKYNVGHSIHSISHWWRWKWEKWSEKKNGTKILLYRICEKVRVGQGADIPFVLNVIHKWNMLQWPWNEQGKAYIIFVASSLFEWHESWGWFSDAPFIWPFDFSMNSSNLVYLMRFSGVG